MRAPEFWSGHAQGRDAAPMLRALLTPVSWLYAGAAALRQATTTPSRVGAPVICIGNVSVGGVGKTPIVRAVRALLAARGVTAHALSRGHGGALKGPVRVDPDLHGAGDVGDEPLLHARDGPAWIARDRLAGARAAAAAGAAAIVMDDGFQNPTLAKDLSFLVVDARDGFGNGAVLPAGPLREPVAAALSRADAVILMGEGDAENDPRLAQRPVLHAELTPAGPAPDGPLVAFAGIGRPQKFFDTLTALGADLADAVPFADHHPYTAQDLDFLLKLAADRGARLVTTEKDHVRLPAAARSAILTLPVTARFADEAALAAFLDRLTYSHP
ncbi:MAG: tetraacyldisaccharide 4'-kinase [Alphaproteobacteria bacterium]|nr:tetraacyldisaccharide 4'-kinase [Alphaproteobacteria bacterium]